MRERGCGFKRKRLLAFSRSPSRVCLLRFVAFSHALAPGAGGFQPLSLTVSYCVSWSVGSWWRAKTERAVGAVLQCVCAEMFLEIQRCLATF